MPPARLAVGLQPQAADGNPQHALQANRGRRRRRRRPERSVGAGRCQLTAALFATGAAGAREAYRRDHCSRPRADRADAAHQSSHHVSVASGLSSAVDRRLALARPTAGLVPGEAHGSRAHRHHTTADGQAPEDSELVCSARAAVDRGNRAHAGGTCRRAVDSGPVTQAAYRAGGCSPRWAAQQKTAVDPGRSQSLAGAWDAGLLANADCLGQRQQCRTSGAARCSQDETADALASVAGGGSASRPAAAKTAKAAVICCMSSVSHRHTFTALEAGTEARAQLADAHSQCGAGG